MGKMAMFFVVFLYGLSPCQSNERKSCKPSPENKDQQGSTKNPMMGESIEPSEWITTGWLSLDGKFLAITSMDHDTTGASMRVINLRTGEKVREEWGSVWWGSAPAEHSNWLFQPERKIFADTTGGGRYYQVKLSPDKKWLGVESMDKDTTGWLLVRYSTSDGKKAESFAPKIQEASWFEDQESTLLFKSPKKADD